MRRIHPGLHRRRWLPAIALLVYLSVSLFSLTPMLAQSTPDPSAPAAAPAQQNTTIYVPLLAGGSGGNPPPPPPPPGSAGGVFVTRNRQTQGAEAAVDPQGGMHFASTALAPLRDDPQAFYSYCPAQPAGACAAFANWRTVALATQVDEVQLALTPDGKPRLMIRQSNIGSGAASKTYYYAECNTACTEAARWQITPVASTNDASAEDYAQPQRSFALDAQGRPRLFFYGGRFGTGSTYGASYASCDTNCTQQDNWTVTEVIERGSIVDYPVLAFTRDGRPRVLAVTYAGGIYLTYITCDAECHDAGNWRQTPILDRGEGQGPVWDLQLDSNDRPRIAFLQGELAGNPERLLYGWCDADCAAGPESWQLLVFGLGPDEQQIGYEPSLALDAQDRPRIAVRTRYDGGGLSFIWCNTACNGPNGDWNDRVIEANTVLDEDTSVPTPANCTPLSWRGGLRPELALDTAGNLRIASDAEWTFRCLYQDPNDPNAPPASRIETFTFTRFTFREAL